MLNLQSVWAPHLIAFHKYKQLSGYKYESAESVINQFDKYYLSLNINQLKLTRDIIEPFLYLKEDTRIATQQWKASVLRQFTIYSLKNNIIDYAYQIPRISLKGEEAFTPYIFAKDELIKINKYLSNYNQKETPGGFNLKPNTINSVSIVFKILMSTGLRLNEALNLTKRNIDFDNTLFIIKEAKNNNQRLVPFSNTLKQELLTYISNTPFRINDNDYLFQIEQNRKLSSDICWVYFKKALNSISLSKGPRIHDLRHTYAVMALTKLQHDEENINLSLSYLSDYLGHKSLKETTKYIWMTPELFKETKIKMNEYTSFIKTIYDGEKYYD